MQARNQTYLDIVSGRYSVEHKLVINSVIYNQNDIVGEPTISRAMYESFGIGNAVSNVIKANVIAKSTIQGTIYAYFRVFNRTQTSDWMPNGVFFLDSKELSNDGITYIVGYDTMIKAEQVLLKEGTWTTQTTLQVATAIATAMGTTLDSATQTLLTNNPYNINTIPIIGEKGTTMREMLQYIAGCYAGNWVANPSGELSLVGLVIPTETSYLIDQIGNPITFGGDRIVL